MTSPFSSGLDRVIHEPARLALVAILSVVESADFIYLQHETELTKGNLSSHLTRLEEAGYVEIEKTYRGRVPLTLGQTDLEGRGGLQVIQKGIQEVPGEKLMSDTIIRTDKLGRDFKSVTAVDDLTLEVQAGTVFGFLGPNGAGKTTTIRPPPGADRAHKGRGRSAGPGCPDRGRRDTGPLRRPSSNTTAFTSG